ncbi:MAG: hypothetical protein K2X29_12205 [Candidatus Obscuribacterales bacterium]|nr:hypothetical protein [Candidatus Obscuribacterales bacterium]
MVHILIAGSTEGAASLQRILQGHKCTVVMTMRAAQTALATEAFDLIAATLHFDDSQMFEFCFVCHFSYNIYYQMHPKFICFLYNFLVKFNSEISNKEEAL